MKKGLKIAGIVIGSLLVLVLLLGILLPIIFKPQILRIAQEELNKRLNADVAFADLDISLIRNFPKATISLERLSVVNRVPFEGDTLASLGQFAVQVNLLSLFNPANLEVQSILLDQLHLYAHRDSLGVANWDIVPKDMAAPTEEPKPEQMSSATNLKLKLKELLIRDARITYLDDSTALNAQLKHLNFQLGGDLGLKQTHLNLDLGVDSIFFASGAITYVPQLALGFRADLDADLENKHFKLEDNEIALNDLRLSLNGSVVLKGDSITTDLELVTQKVDLAGLLSLVPTLYTKDLKGLKTAGELQLTGYVQGTKFGKELPDAQVQLTIKDGMFQYPMLPKAVTGLNLDFAADIRGKEQDSSILKLRNLSFVMGGNPVQMRASVETPITDPALWAEVSGKVDLATLKESIPLEGKELTGRVALDLSVAANLSSIKKKQFEDVAVDGLLEIEDAKLTQVVAEQDAMLDRLQLRFSQKKVALEEFTARLGSSDLQLQGAVSDFLPYYFSDGVLTGHLDLVSKCVDLRELMPGGSEESQQEAAPAAETPANTLTDEQLSMFRRLAFDLGMHVETLYFQDYVMRRAGGKLDTRDGELRIANLGCVLFEGDARISGLVNLQTADYQSSLDVSVKDLNVVECAKSVKLIRKLVPGIEYASGRVGLQFTSASHLNSNFAPRLETINATGKLDVGELAIKNSPLFSKFGELLKNKELANPTFRGGVAKFVIENGTLTFDPYPLKIKDIEGNIAGNVKLDQTLDMKLAAKIPSALLGNLGTSVSSLLQRYTGAKIPENIPVWVRATGNVTQPKIDFGVEQLGTDNIKEVVQEQVTKVVEQVKEKAYDEAQKLITEAQKHADELVAQAKVLADKTREEAKKRAQQIKEEGEKNGLIAAIAAKKAAEIAEREGEKAAQKIENEAQKKADELIAKAKAEAEKLH